MDKLDILTFEVIFLVSFSIVLGLVTLILTIKDEIERKKKDGKNTGIFPRK